MHYTSCARSCDFGSWLLADRILPKGHTRSVLFVSCADTPRLVTTAKMPASVMNDIHLACTNFKRGTRHSVSVAHTVDLTLPYRSAVPLQTLATMDYHISLSLVIYNIYAALLPSPVLITSGIRQKADLHSTFGRRKALVMHKQ